MHLLLDLDGTLVDSAPGIARCLNHALVEVGAAPARECDLRAMIGRPLFGIFETLLSGAGPDAHARAVEVYRARFDELALAGSRLFPGVEEALHAFRLAGHSLQIVTVKPVDPAVRVLRHLGIDGLFRAVHGAPPDERAVKKSHLVRAALERVQCGPADAVMIGDRAEDMAAARSHGLRAVGVAWGYGRPEELVDAGADYLAADAGDLVGWIDAGPQRTGRTLRPW